MYALFYGRERVLNIFNKNWGRGFSDKVSDHSNLKVLTPKQILQKLPTTLAQVKGGTTSETLLNEIRQIIYSLCREKEVTKKISNNFIKL